MDLLQEQLGVAGVQMETLEKRRHLARSDATCCVSSLVPLRFSRSESVSEFEYLPPQAETAQHPQAPQAEELNL